eukprot:COSAG01_NODE_7411_length_3218_cov_1.345624_1_plen_348_part_10
MGADALSAAGCDSVARVQALGRDVAAAVARFGLSRADAAAASMARLTAPAIGAVQPAQRAATHAPSPSTTVAAAPATPPLEAADPSLLDAMHRRGFLPVDQQKLVGAGVQTVEQLALLQLEDFKSLEVDSESCAAWAAERERVTAAERAELEELMSSEGLRDDGSPEIKDARAKLSKFVGSIEMLSKMASSDFISSSGRHHLRSGNVYARLGITARGWATNDTYAYDWETKMTAAVRLACIARLLTATRDVAAPERAQLEQLMLHEAGGISEATRAMLSKLFGSITMLNQLASEYPGIEQLCLPAEDSQHFPKLLCGAGLLVAGRGASADDHHVVHWRRCGCHPAVWM